MRLFQIKIATGVLVLLSVATLLALNRPKLEDLSRVGAQYLSDGYQPTHQSFALSMCPFQIPSTAKASRACLPPRPTSRKTALIGVWSSAQDFDRRALIRLTYRRYKPHDIDVYFILGQPETDAHQTLVGLEMAAHHDILILNTTENLTEGKTFEFFHTVGTIFEEGDYVFVTKIDSDVWCELPQFAARLQALIRQGQSTGTYFGRAIHETFMAGMAYTLSWDLVRWVATDPYPASHREGFEDQVVGDWLHRSGSLNHFVSEDQAIYDSPDYLVEGGWARNYTDGTLIVHQLKQNEWFLRTAKHFLGQRDA